ncbi:hypothetical protein GGR56DRAFT_695498, partial [Xylariaceae sp. FL0804]
HARRSRRSTPASIPPLAAGWSSGTSTQCSFSSSSQRVSSLSPPRTLRPAGCCCCCCCCCSRRDRAPGTGTGSSASSSMASSGSRGHNRLGRSWRPRGRRALATPCVAAPASPSRRLAPMASSMMGMVAVGGWWMARLVGCLVACLVVRTLLNLGVEYLMKRCVV